MVASIGKGKGKGHLVTGHEGPEGEQRYSSTLSLTSALDEGGQSMPLSGRSTPRESLRIVQDNGRVPGPSGRVEKN